MSDNKIEIFKEITIGNLSKDELLQRLKDSDIQFNKYANMLFSHSQFIPPLELKKFKLIKTSLHKLGLEDSCSFEEFTNRILIKGFKFCPLYLAAFLRLEYLDQPEGPYLTIASEMPESDMSYPNGFYIRKNDGILWLRGYQADSFEGWPEDNEFIFALK